MVDKSKWFSGTPLEMLGFNLQDAARLQRRNFDRHLHARGVDLTQAQWRSIGIVWKRPGISQTALADILEIQPISVGRLIDRMESAGWMERRPDPDDRRAVCLYVTSKAEPTLKAIKATADDIRSVLTKGINKSDLETAAKVLVTMRANLVDADGGS
jgi:DNA-binding MarR family transcriptional regulator